MLIYDNFQGYGADGGGFAHMHAEGELLFDDDAQLSKTTVSVQFTGFEVSIFKRCMCYCRAVRYRYM